MVAINNNKLISAGSDEMKKKNLGHEKHNIKKSKIKYDIKYDYKKHKILLLT